jgi:hypothetical protein
MLCRVFWLIDTLAQVFRPPRADMSRTACEDSVFLDLSPTVCSGKTKFSFAEAKYQVSKAKIFSSLFECEPHHMISVKEIKDA